MYKQIFKEIKKHKNIVIARHVRVDPDAMASQCALRDSIKLTFPDKNVYAIGAGTVRFNYMGKLDRGVNFDELEDILLIVTDTPDKKRVDMSELTHYESSIKIDHHIYMETFCDIELIETHKSSAAEMIYDLIKNTKLKMNKEIAEILYVGICGDTNRFLVNTAPSTYNVVHELISNYQIDTVKCHQNLYKRSFSEVELLGYMSSNMKITDNGVGYVKIDESIIKKYNVDTISTGDLVNNFNNVNELLVWLTATEDVKNSCIRVSIRSRGPIVNKVAERFNGGGHKFASGARVPSFEEVDDLIKELDKLCIKYIESCDEDEN